MVAQHVSAEPKFVKETLSGPNARKWTDAMKNEMESTRTNQVWDLVDIPPGRKAIGNEWILKIKRKTDESIERFKALLVVKSYTQ